MEPKKNLIILKRKNVFSRSYATQAKIEIKEENDDDVEMLNVNLENWNNAATISKINGVRQSTITEPITTTIAMPSTSSKTNSEVDWKDIHSAFKNRIKTGVIINKAHIDPKRFLDDCRNVLKSKVENAFKNAMALKINAIFCCEFKIIKDEKEKFEPKYMDAKCASLYQYDDFDIWYARQVEHLLLNSLETLQEHESGWALSAIIDLTININKYTMLQGSSFIALPKGIKGKGACVNVRNKDEACFAWAVVSALYPVSNDSNRISKYPHYKDVLNLKDIKFPMTINQIPRFERQNNLSINVFTLKLNTEKRTTEKYIVAPMYVSKDVRDKHINLLLIQNRYDNKDSSDYEDDEDVRPLKYHYVWIKNMSRLLSSQLSAFNSTKYICNRCLHHFIKSEKLSEHMENCPMSAKISLPKKAVRHIEFKNYSKRKKAPFVIYAGLEWLFNETSVYNHRVLCNLAYFVKCSYDPTLSFYKSYRGDDCMAWLTRELQQFAEDVSTVYFCDYPRKKLTALEKKVFSNKKKEYICHVCEKPIPKFCKKLPIYCRFTGAYKGPVHEICIMNFRESYAIPVFFHGLKDLDSLLVMKYFKNGFEGGIDINVIKNDKSFITFTKRTDFAIKLRFIDSTQFMSDTLDTLASYLDAFPIFRSQMSDVTDEQFSLLTTKMVYPHSYVDSSAKFEEITLPSISKFGDVTQLEYDHVKRLWKALKLQNVGEYSDLCLKTKVLLLAEVFEEFRDKCLEKYEVDPSYYHTLPAYSWDVMLRQTKILLEILTDIEMVNFVERGTRASLSQCSMRHSKANNIYLEGYISTKPSKYLMQFGMNDLYSWAMSQYLPYGKFQWVDDLIKFDVETVPDDSLIGYILEVDLEYPTDMHDMHKDLPFFPEYQFAPDSKSQKRLMATLCNKVNYVVHYRNLKQALKHGLVLTKIHRILQFEQSPWLKPYIDLNRSLSVSGKNDFERNLFELMNYSVFEKFVENIRSDCKFRFATKWEKRFGAESLISKAEFKSSTIINEELVLLQFDLSEIHLTKPIYVGMCIQDLVKTRIYDFHYQYMQTKFQYSSICYVDIDTILYELISNDVYISMREDCEKQFDTSDYPYDNLWDIPRVNRQALGLVKDMNNSRVISEFVGLRSKMYAVKLDDSFKPMPFKGISKEVVSSRISFKDYANCLVNEIQSKVEMSLQDNKPHLMKNRCEALPWGHYSLTLEY